MSYTNYIYINVNNIIIHVLKDPDVSSKGTASYILQNL
jgi:hypothetical protein